MSKQSRLNRKFDRIKRLEESGELKRRKQGNRALRKFLNNRLAIVGGAIFLVILLSCIFAPFLASYSPTAVAVSYTHLFSGLCASSQRIKPSTTGFSSFRQR